MKMAIRRIGTFGFDKMQLMSKVRSVSRYVIVNRIVHIHTNFDITISIRDFFYMARNHRRVHNEEAMKNDNWLIYHSCFLIG